MGKLRTIRNNWSEKSFWTDTVVPYLFSTKGIYWAYSWIRLGKPTDVMEEDWDNLIILDACRYDEFKQENLLEGTLEHRVSQGCVTGDFLLANFTEDYPDTVFIAGNPHAERKIPGRFHSYVPAWRTHWDDDLGTVPPDEMSKLTQEISREYPNKRIVSHYVQPHTPYIGPEAIKKFGKHRSFNRAKEWVEVGKEEIDEYFIPLEALQNGETSREAVIDAYRENLRLALTEVESLISEIPGKTVITSDHGELFDEYAWPLPKKMTGHLGGIRTPNLVKVPWFIPNYNNRKEIVSDGIESVGVNKKQEMKEKLKYLGYMK